MRKIHIVGLALAAVFAFSAFSAAAAFAASEWLVDGAAVPSTAKVHVEQSGTLELWDMKAKVKLLCTGTGLGLVWEKLDTVEEAKANTCTVEEGSCGSPNAVAKNLPWNTEIVLVGSAFRDTLRSSGAGSPGWDVTCFGFVEDTCLSETGSTLLTVEGENVLANFDEESGEANCTVGGAGGLVKGVLTTKALEGLTLSVS
jgi:hypothetical protein